MKKNEKIFIGILAAITIVIIIAIAIVNINKGNKKENNTSEDNNTVKEEFVDVLDDGTKLNKSTKLNQMKDFEGLKVGNIQLTEQNNQTLLLADVKNETATESKLKLINIILYDKSGNQLVKLSGIIGPLKAGETTQLNVSSSLDYANAYDFKIENQQK